MELLWKIVCGFGMFWWDFLVGDTPELFVTTVLTLGVTALISEVAHIHTGLVVVLLPSLVVASLIMTVVRTVGRR